MKSKSLFVCLCVVVFASVTRLGITRVNAQGDKKIIQLAFSVNPQIKFNDLKIGKQLITLGKSFDADSNWIEDLTFNLENVSSKSIVFLQVNVNFPETRTTGNLMSYGKTFGLRPDSKFKSNNEPLVLKPGETLKVDLDKEKDRMYKFINDRQPLQLIHKIELEISFIIFEDKTAWSAGTFMRQDSNNPDRYNPVESQSQQ